MGSNDNEEDLFTEEGDAHDERHDRHAVPTGEEVKSFLRRLMGTDENRGVPVKEIKLVDENLLKKVFKLNINEQV